MAVIKIEVAVEKETFELASGAAKMILELKKALADGWQMGQDMPVVISAIVADLVPAIQGVEKMGLESQEDMAAFIKAWSLPAMDLAGAFLKKPAVVPV